MKKMKKKYFVGLCLLVAMIAISACSDSENSLPAPEVTGICGVTEQKLGDIVAEDSGAVTWQAHFTAILKDAQQGNSEEDSLKATLAERRLAKADSILNVYIDSLGSNDNLHGEDGKEDKSFWNGYKYVNIRYHSIDVNGATITLSELLIIPFNSVFPNPHPNNIIVACHDMITSNNQKPTSFSTDEIKSFANWASSKLITESNNENLVIVPDYQGYGATHGDSHSFLNSTLTARQVVDGVRAAKIWFENYEKSLEKDFKTVVTGYGEGGSVAMAVHRYIEQNDLSDELNFAGSSCGGGLYDPQATLTHYIQNGKVYDLATLGMIIKSLCENSIMKQENASPSHFFTDAFLKSGIMDWLSNKTYNNEEIQEKLLDYSWNNSNGFSMMRESESDNKYLPYTSANAYNENGKKRSWYKNLNNHPVYCEIENVFRPEVIEFLKSGRINLNVDNYKVLDKYNKAMAMYALDKDWLPKHPMVVVHSYQDEVFPIINYENASKTFSGYRFKGFHYGAGAKYVYHANSEYELYFENVGAWMLFNVIEGDELQKYKHDNAIQYTATENEKYRIGTAG